MVTGIQRYRSSSTAVAPLSAQDVLAFRNMQPAQSGPLTGQLLSAPKPSTLQTGAGLLDTASKAKDAYSFATNPSSFGASTGPVSSAVNQFGANAFGLSASGYALNGSAVSAGEAALLTKAGATKGLTSAPTLSGALGAAGIGAFTGSYIAKFTGGNSTGGSIGGGLGAGVGYAFGGPVGGVIGNVAGSLLGSKFGGGGVKHPAAYIGNAKLDTSGNITGGSLQSKHMGGDIPSSIAQDFSMAIKNSPFDVSKEQGFGFAYDPGLFGKGTPARITIGRDAEKYNSVLAETTKRVAKEEENKAMLKALQNVPVLRSSINDYLSANNNSFDYNNYFNGLQDSYTKSLATGISARTGRNEGTVETTAYKAADEAAPQISYNFNPNDQKSVQDTYSKIYDELATRGVLKKRAATTNTNTTPASQIVIAAPQQSTPTTTTTDTQFESPFTKFLREYRSKQNANLA